MWDVLSNTVPSLPRFPCCSEILYTDDAPPHSDTRQVSRVRGRAYPKARARMGPRGDGGSKCRRQSTGGGWSGSAIWSLSLRQTCRRASFIHFYPPPIGSQCVVSKGGRRKALYYLVSISRIYRVRNPPPVSAARWIGSRINKYAAPRSSSKLISGTGRTPCGRRVAPAPALAINLILSFAQTCNAPPWTAFELYRCIINITDHDRDHMSSRWASPGLCIGMWRWKSAGRCARRTLNVDGWSK